jgi:hypothetical protein
MSVCCCLGFFFGFFTGDFFFFFFVGDFPGFSFDGDCDRVPFEGEWFARSPSSSSLLTTYRT